MRIIEYLTALSIPFTDEQLKKLEAYTLQLLSWNQKINLTTARDEEAVAMHIADCAIALKLIPDKFHGNTIDVGAGAGFPGIILAIFCPDVSFTLLDSLEKRCDFLEHVRTHLSLKNVSILHGRAETAAQDFSYRERFQLAVARAVAPTRILCEYVLPFVKKDGYAVFYKGPLLQDELTEAKNAISLLGGGNETILPCPLPDKQHFLCMIEKKGKTPKQYPRSAGTPKKKPL